MRSRLCLTVFSDGAIVGQASRLPYSTPHAMPTLDRITLYPVKSLDGVAVSEARVLPAG
jgi:hypothetical protein